MVKDRDMRRGGKKERPVYRKPKAEAVSCRLTVERLAWGGRGMARSEDGRLILLQAPLALFPGEVVEAEVHWKPRHGEGKVVSWVKRSPDRVEPDCRWAESCGGCDLLGAGRHGAGLKRSMVEDLLRRALPQAPEWAWLPAPVDTFRHRIQLHWNGTELGFHARGSHHVVPIEGCPAAAPCLSKAIPRLREALVEAVLPTRPGRWELATGTPAGDLWAIDGEGQTWLLEPSGFRKDKANRGIPHAWEGLTLRHGAGAFFQVCPPWAFEAFGQVLQSWDVKGGTLFDLYGGVGLFSALLGDRFQKRVLVEGFEPAVEWARKNLAEAGLEAECTAQDVGLWITEGLGEPGDVILLDPPRTGLAPEVVAPLLTAQADTLVLIGCDGAAFCRDVARLAPVFELASLAVLDLFPGTSHVECVGLLKRKA